MTALGFRIKSGYAIAVVLAGRAKAPTVVARRVVDLCNPDAPETRQPYHDGFYKEENDSPEIARRVKIVKRCARSSMNTLVEETCGTRQPGESARAALVVGSVIDPIRLATRTFAPTRTKAGSFARYRGCAAIARHRVRRDRREATRDDGSSRLRRPDAEIKRALAVFGKTVGGPWRAEEKAADAPPGSPCGDVGRSSDRPRSRMDI